MPRPSGVIKALLVLTPISSVTWVLGLATLPEDVSTVPHYISTILTTSQVGGDEVAVLCAILEVLSHCQSLLKVLLWWSRGNMAREV